MVARAMILALVVGAVFLMHQQYCCPPDTLSGVSRYRWIVQVLGSNVVQAVLLSALGRLQHLEWCVASSSGCSASESRRLQG